MNVIVYWKELYAQFLHYLYKTWSWIVGYLRQIPVFMDQEIKKITGDIRISKLFIYNAIARLNSFPNTTGRLGVNSTVCVWFTAHAWIFIGCIINHPT